MNFPDIAYKTESTSPMLNNLYGKIIGDPNSTDELGFNIFQEIKGQCG